MSPFLVIRVIEGRNHQPRRLEVTGLFGTRQMAVQDWRRNIPLDRVKNPPFFPIQEDIEKAVMCSYDLCQKFGSTLEDSEFIELHISEGLAGVISRSHEVRLYMQGAPDIFAPVTVNPNEKYGLPERLYGCRLVVGFK